MPHPTILYAASLLAADLLSAPPTPAGPALSLAQAEQNALRHQPTVREAVGQTEAATGRVDEARAGYLPQVNAVGTYYFAKSGGVGVTTTGMPVATGMSGESERTLYLTR